MSEQDRVSELIDGEIQRLEDLRKLPGWSPWILWLAVIALTGEVVAFFYDNGELAVPVLRGAALLVSTYLGVYVVGIAVSSIKQRKMLQPPRLGTDFAPVRRKFAAMLGLIALNVFLIGCSGFDLWPVLGICVGLAVLAAFFVALLWLSSKEHLPDTSLNPPLWLIFLIGGAGFVAGLVMTWWDHWSSLLLSKDVLFASAQALGVVILLDMLVSYDSYAPQIERLRELKRQYLLGELSPNAVTRQVRQLVVSRKPTDLVVPELEHMADLMEALAFRLRNQSRVLAGYSREFVPQAPLPEQIAEVRHYLMVGEKTLSAVYTELEKVGELLAKTAYLHGKYGVGLDLDSDPESLRAMIDYFENRADYMREHERLNAILVDLRVVAGTMPVPLPPNHITTRQW